MLYVSHGLYELDDGGFGSVALGLSLHDVILVGKELGVGVDGGDSLKSLEMLVFWVELLEVVPVEVRGVFCLVDCVVVDYVGDSHSVLGQGTRLVGTDDGHGAQGLDDL